MPFFVIFKTNTTFVSVCSASSQQADTNEEQQPDKTIDSKDAVADPPNVPQVCTGNKASLNCSICYLS